MEYKDISYLYRRVEQLKRWHVSSELNSLGAIYYGQLHLLDFVVSHPGCTQKDLADRFALSKASITKSVKRMIKNGLITREINPEDERKFQLFASDLGMEVNRKCLDVFVNIDELTFKGFSEEEIKVFSELLTRMMDNLETDYSRNKSIRQLVMESEKKEESEDKQQ